MNVEYEYQVETTGITPYNLTEGLLSFKFELEILPDIGKIEFNGDCILFSNVLKSLVMILKADKNTLLWKKNQDFINGLHKFLLRRCLDYSKKIGEKEGIHFHSYELILKEEGLEHISFNREEKKILSLKENKLILFFYNILYYFSKIVSKKSKLAFIYFIL